MSLLELISINDPDLWIILILSLFLVSSISMICPDGVSITESFGYTTLSLPVSFCVIFTLVS